jgi:hypothetical protein
MRGLFRRKKKYKGDSEKKRPTKLGIKPFEYHPKIILAWAKGIEGNDELLDYLYKSGYNELVMATHAIQLKDKARDWLMENGYPHIMAMINGSEGNTQALTWLKKNGFELLYHMALAIDGDPKGFKWINIHGTQDIFLLTKSIMKVKDEIEERHNDVHSMN